MGGAGEGLVVVFGEGALCRAVPEECGGEKAQAR